ncbi:hypothetical protein MSMAC_2509 [Methanosarcina mazei C16]|uniref:AAA+ ATPase domain-containing protein n=1 Tax=Methanosarcina mazei C16 TaxID=1434113 RepID=A0A0E3RWH8_METMZ|nr:hypothetical protein MSMAC_2509 [Methanosarcina mazei C16]
MKKQLLELVNSNKEIHVFDENETYEVELRKYEDIDNNWTENIRLVSVVKESEIPDNIENRIYNTLDNLFEVFLKISEIESVYVKGRGSVIIEEDSASMKNECLRMKKLLSNKKQVILYGPPGTGKTYVASNFIKSNTSDQIYNEKQTIPYDPSKKDDTFVTSNLIKSDTSDQTTKEKISIDRKFFFYGSKLTYPKIQELWNKSESTLDINSNMHRKETIDIIKAGDMLFIYAASPRKKVIGIAEFIQKELQWDGKLIFRIKNLKQMRNGPTLEDLRNDSILSKSEPIINELKGNLNPINKDAALRLLKLSKVSLDNSNVENIIEPEVVQNHEFSKVEKIAEPEISKNHELITYYEFITFHPSFSYEDFIEGLRPLNNDDGQISYKVDEGLFKRYSRFAFNALMAKAEIEKEWGQMENIPQLTVEEKEKAKKAAGEVSFYLVIDEINRGDISRIFGELITLLESDKRLTADNELIITLPYSKTKFAVSPNLYLIGTMNTADKSIALIDIALRRRFGFIEMMPDYSVLEEKLVNEDKDIKEVFDLSIQALKKVNENILKTYDRDHQIGHSYLLKLKDSKSRNDAIEDFRFIWYYEILPLMQEYFYDAPAKLKQVLGNEFIVVENRSFSFIDNLEGEEFIKTIQRVVNSEKRQNEIGD